MFAPSSSERGEMTQTTHMHEVDQYLIRVVEYLEENRETFDTIDRNVFAIF
jgi:hypothetical protein